MPFTPRTISDNFEKLPFSEDEKALLRRCLETPWDDAPLLVYADWVEEHGEEERADFIRKQVRTGETVFWGEAPKEVREWGKKVFSTPKGRGHFYRGLPSRFYLDNLGNTPNRLKKALEKLSWDWCCEMAYVCGDAEYNKVFFSDARIQQLIKLDIFANDVSDEGDENSLEVENPIPYLVESPYLTNLIRLSFDAPVSNAGMKQLAGAENLQNLISLVFESTTFNKSTMRILTQGESLGNLTDLNIGDEVKLEALRELATSQFAKQLTTLCLGYAAVTSKGAEVIAKAKNFQNLRKLDVSGHTVGDAGTKHLATSPYLKELRWLNLRLSELGKNGVSLLGNSRTFSKLEYLDLSWNFFRDGGAIALTKSKHLESLKDLNLTECEIGTKGMLALVNSEFIGRLEVLRIGGNEFDSEIIKALAKNTHISKLKELRFDLERTSKANRKILQKSPYLQQCKLIHDD